MNNPNRVKIRDVAVWQDVRSRPGEETVTLQEKGGLLFSVQLVKNDPQLMLGYCVLGYDKPANAILISFTSDSQIKGVRKVSYRPKMKNCSLQIKTFFNHFGLNPKELKGRYKLEKITVPRKGEWSVIYLNERLDR